jgi:hypothetical protein
VYKGVFVISRQAQRTSTAQELACQPGSMMPGSMILTASTQSVANCRLSLRAQCKAATTCSQPPGADGVVAMAWMDNMMLMMSNLLIVEQWMPGSVTTMHSMLELQLLRLYQWHVNGAITN